MSFQDSLPAIRQALASENPADGVEMLSNAVLYANEQQLAAGGIAELADKVQMILRNTKKAAVAEKCARCISNMINASRHATRALARSEICTYISEKLGVIKHDGARHEFTKVLEHMGRHDPETLWLQSDLSGILDSFQRQPLENQRVLLATYSLMSDRMIVSYALQIVCRVGEYMTHDDPEIAYHAVNYVMNITTSKGIPVDAIYPMIVHQIAAAFMVLTDFKLISMLFTALQRMVRDSVVLATEFLKADVDFGLIFEQTDFKTKHIERLTQCLDLIMSLLPAPKNAPRQFIHRKLLGSRRFAAVVEPFIEKLLLQRTGPTIEVLQVMSSILSVYTPANIEEIIESLVAHHKVAILSSHVMHVIDNMKDREIASRVISMIQKTSDVSKINNFEDLEKLTKCKSNEIHSFDILSEIRTYVKSITGKIGGKERAVLVDLTNHCHNILSMYTMPSEDTKDNNRIIGGNFSVNITDGAEFSVSASCPALSTLSPTEWMWNQNVNHITEYACLKAIGENPELARIMVREHIAKNKDHIDWGVLNRAAKTPGYRRVKISLQNKPFSVLDSLLPAFASTLSDPSLLKSVIPTSRVIPMADDEEEVRHKYEPRPIKDDSMTCALEILTVIHRLDPTIDITAHIFAKHVFPSLASVIGSIGRFSLAANLLARYPFAFPFDMRLLYAKCVNFPGTYGPFTIRNKFSFSEQDSRPPALSTVKCQVSRADIWKDGHTVLKYFGPGSSTLDIVFEGEHGVGFGPTNEFFNLFGLEMLRTSHNMWQRNIEDKEFVFMNNHGLYPRPSADPHEFYTMGLLMAKGLLGGCMVPIPLNPAFIAVIHDQVTEQTYNLIDATLMTSLSCTEALYGLTFVFPGDEDCVLCEGGEDLEVDESNVDEYVRLVKEKMLCRNLIDAFKRGFNQALPIAIFDSFTDEEAARLFYGSIAQITISDLQQHVTVSNGYTKDSPAIKFFFEIISEMQPNELEIFLEFATGSRHLPPGGLKDLTPALTVAKKDLTSAGELPSVMTCTNYFKLPPYETKEIMKERITKALVEGRNVFTFT